MTTPGSAEMVRYLDSVLSRTGYVPAPPAGDQLVVWRTAGPLVQARTALFLAQRTGHTQEPAALAELSAVLGVDLATGTPSPVLAALAALEDHPRPRAVLGAVLDVAARAHTPGRGVCPFCAIAAGDDPLARIVHETDETVAFIPRDPATGIYGGVTDGHVLVIPRVHVPDMLSVPEVTGTVMEATATLARQDGLTDANAILNLGQWGTATVDHMHAHLVPRREGDGLPLPWDPHARQHRPAPASAPQ
ncbi:HIT family protein [Nocardiopsis alba]|uniref:HIT family protein n=1 Tax=Nocardiopsis alba TaxID=53437 RepID=UPI00366D4EDC